MSLACVAIDKLQNAKKLICFKEEGILAHPPRNRLIVVFDCTLIHYGFSSISIFPISNRLFVFRVSADNTDRDKTLRGIEPESSGV